MICETGTLWFKWFCSSWFQKEQSDSHFSLTVPMQNPTGWIHLGSKCTAVRHPTLLLTVCQCGIIVARTRLHSQWTLFSPSGFALAAFDQQVLAFLLLLGQPSTTLPPSPERHYHWHTKPTTIWQRKPSSYPASLHWILVQPTASAYCGRIWCICMLILFCFGCLFIGNVHPDRSKLCLSAGWYLQLDQSTWKVNLRMDAFDRVLKNNNCNGSLVFVAESEFGCIY